MASVRELLDSMGVEAYEPRVLHQLLEYMQQYSSEIFADAVLYAEHAGRKRIESEDVLLSARLKAAATQVHAPQLMEWMARQRNRNDLQPLTTPNIQLPNLKHCLVEENYQFAPPPRPTAAPAEQAPTPTAAAEPSATTAAPGQSGPVTFKIAAAPGAAARSAALSQGPAWSAAPAEAEEEEDYDV